MKFFEWMKQWRWWREKTCDHATSYRHPVHDDEGWGFDHTCTMCGKVLERVRQG